MLWVDSNFSSFLKTSDCIIYFYGFTSVNAYTFFFKCGQVESNLNLLSLLSVSIIPSNNLDSIINVWCWTFLPQNISINAQNTHQQKYSTWPIYRTPHAVDGFPVLLMIGIMSVPGNHSNSNANALSSETVMKAFGSALLI